MRRPEPVALTTCTGSSLRSPPSSAVSAGAMTAWSQPRAARRRADWPLQRSRSSGLTSGSVRDRHGDRLPQPDRGSRARPHRRRVRPPGRETGYSAPQGGRGRAGDGRPPSRVPWTMRHPAAVRASICRSRFCPPVDTRAYPILISVGLPATHWMAQLGAVRAALGRGVAPQEPSGGAGAPARGRVRLRVSRVGEGRHVPRAAGKAGSYGIWAGRVNPHGGTVFSRKRRGSVPYHRPDGAAGAAPHRSRLATGRPPSGVAPGGVHRSEGPNGMSRHSARTSEVASSAT